jgi:DNA helicase HerA-like ATPase
MTAAGQQGADFLGGVLRGLPGYLVSEIPRRDTGQPDGPDVRPADPGRAQRAAALTAAYHGGLAGNTPGRVALGWVRTEVGGPVRVVAAGAALVGGPVPGGPVPGGVPISGGRAARVLLALPAGARATPLPGGELVGLIAALGCWREVTLISDPLLTGGGQQGDGATRAGLSLDDGLLGSWTGPFGWLVTAEPVPPAELHVMAEETGRRQRVAEGSADRFPGQAAQARRLQQRHTELERGRSAGFWRITLAAGGADEAGAARVAGLLCATTPLDGLPYALSPVPLAAPSSAWSGQRARPGERPADPGSDGEPGCGSTDLLAALARPPEAEVPGVRFAVRPEFDVTPETAAARIDAAGIDAAGTGDPRTGASIELGEVLDRNLMPAGPFALPTGSLNRHVFVCGATGAGKSQTVRCLLESATGRGIPWLVVEPAKAEYRLMAARLPDTEVIRIRPGEPDAVAAGLNPLEPAADGTGGRFPLQTHADLVRALFNASFQAEEPFPQVLAAALSRVYTGAGWDLALGEPSRAGAAYPTLTGLQRAAEQVVAEIGYSQRVTDDVLGFIRVRLASLRHGTTGRFLEGGHPLDFGALLRSNVVLEIEDVGDDADKAFLMGTVLIRLAEHLRLTHRTGPAAPAPGLTHLTVVEEAHRLLRRPEPDGSGRTGAAGHAVELFAGLLAEIRAYGEGLVIAEQIPARLVPDVIKNTAVKITHRLPAADDREAVGATMNATPAQSRYLVTLPPGQAAVFCDGMDFPVLVQIKDGTERERASTAPAADSGSVVRPRSASCGAACAARPCTLREMRGGQRVLEDTPWLAVWAELTVLAHLTGWPMPVPVPGALSGLRAMPARSVHCAAGHAVDAAVAVRPAIARPADLARHAAEAIRARADRGEWWCEPDEPQWLLTGQVTQEAAFGVVRPSVLEGNRIAGGAALPGSLDEAQAGAPDATFIDCRWPARYLAPAPPGAPPPS